MEGTDLNNNNPADLGGNELQDLYAQLGNGGAPEQQNQLPEKIGEIALSDFEKLLEQGSGGKVKKLQDVLTFAEKAKEVDHLKSKLSEFELKANETPFKNDFVKRLNDLYAKGAKDAEIDRFIAAQKMDISKMSALDKVKQSMSLQYPDLTGEEINAVISQQYGSDSEAEMSPEKAAMLKMESRKADEVIKSFIASAGETENERTYKAQQAEMQQHHAIWSKIVSDTQSHFKKVVFEVDIPGSDQKLAIPFDVPNETMKGILPQIAAMAAQSKAKPTLESFNQQKAMYQNMVAAVHLNQILQTALQTVKMETIQQMRKEYAGMGGGNGGGKKFVNPFGKEGNRLPPQNQPPRESGNKNGVEQSKNFFSSRPKR